MISSLRGGSLTCSPLPTASGRTPSGLGLMVSPAGEERSILRLLEHEPRLIRDLLAGARAVLFRGFRVDMESEFGSVARLACGELSDAIGEHPDADLESGVYRPVLYAPNQKLLWHNENSFHHTWPKTIVFGCRVAATSGGETPIADSALVYEAMGEKICRKFHQAGVRYVRNCNPLFGRRWQDLYQTSDRHEVERLSATRNEHIHWSDDHHLRVEAIRPAFVWHHGSDRWVWFNQILHWHPACLAPAVRAMLEAKLGAGDMPRNCSFGDGEPIPDDLVRQLIQAYQQCETKFSWHDGDILVLDNLACAHAREPYSGRREHLVAMGDMGSFDEHANPVSHLPRDRNSTSV